MTQQINFQLRYPKGDEDIIKIFHFLCVVARPVLLGPVDAQKAVSEVGRVVMDPFREEGPEPDSFAIVAEINGELVGTIGVVTMEDWYGHRKFMTNRWFFVFPQIANSGIGAALLADAGAMCAQIGMDLVIHRNTHGRRNRSSGRGIIFTSPPQVMRAGDAKNSMQ